MTVKGKVVKVDGKDVIVLPPSRETFAQRFAHGAGGNEAMRAAGYSESSIGHRGPSWLLKNELVAKRIEQIQDKLMSGVREDIRKELVKVPKLLGKAIEYMDKVLDGKDREGEVFVGEQHKTRIAMRILAVGEALMIAEIPKRFEVYKVSIAVMRQEAMERDHANLG